MHTAPGPSRRALRWSTACVALAASWYASLATHEAGHALAGALTGAQSVHTHLPLLGFSRTDLAGDQHPLVTTAAGFVGGALVPLLIWLAAAAARVPGRTVLAFWSGFALVFNGAYLAADAVARAGDGAVLVREGTPVWAAILAGLLLGAAGLRIWHALGAHPDPRAAQFAAALTLLVCSLIAVAMT
ncbi:MAG: hypothetical protein IT431_10140 [Phycisphaerales bacterium]|nr:hypothetical protein [Phycisphaerales bacterium]